MKYYILLVVFLLLFACCKRKDDYAPAKTANEYRYEVVVYWHEGSPTTYYAHTAYTGDGGAYLYLQYIKGEPDKTIYIPMHSMKKWEKTKQ